MMSLQAVNSDRDSRCDRVTGTTMLRTCMYTPSPRGGHARYTRELLGALSAHDGGTSVYPELVTSQDLEAAFDSADYAINRILPRLAARHEFSNPASWAWSRLRHYYRRERAFLDWLASRDDIAVVHLQEFAPWLLHGSVREMHRLRKRVFYTVHNVTPHSYPPGVPRRLHDGWRRDGLRATDGLFVHSQGLRAALEQFLGPGAPPIYVIPHGVWSIAASGTNARFRERIGGNRLLFFGSIRENKGLHHLLDALTELPQFSLTIAGYPSDRQYFETAIVPRINKLRDTGQRVELVDRFIDEDDVDSYFRSHSAIVMPYTRGFAAQSGVAYLAIAHAIPMVATPAGGLGEIFDVARVGRLSDGFDAPSLVAAIRSLFEKESWEALEREFQIARDHFSWAAAARETARAYCDAASVTGGTDAQA